jgi:ABC-type iron transport system FetAB ATPase subunit
LQIKKLQRLLIGPLSLAIDAGQCLGISGPSGTGKSLLLRAIADLDPHDGEVWLEGVRCRDISPVQWRTRVGLLPPESCWWLARVVDHFRNGTPVPLEALGLSPAILQEPVVRLSSGEKQRLALLRLLANRPQVLLLDEPTANLDPANTQRVEEFISDYRQDRSAAVIWVSHDREQIARIANRHFMMVDGQLQEQAMGHSA